jgi:serine/threonine protein kinase
MENQTVTRGLEVGQITGNLKVIKCLQEGKFGRVLQVMDIRSKKEFVTKEIRSNQAFEESEAFIHRKLNHPNVIQCFEVRWEDDLVYIDMELGASCLYNDLYIKKCVTSEMSWQYFRDLIDGVEYLHSMKVAHRNIEPGNLLIGSDGRLKIADFGWASIIGPVMGGGCQGALQYHAPEMVRQELYRLEPADIWACGIVLFEMLFKRLPWISVVSSLYRQWKIKNCQYPFDFFDESALGLIVFMLKEDPNVRATIPDIKNHPWFMNGQLNL